MIKNACLIFCCIIFFTFTASAQNKNLSPLQKHKQLEFRSQNGFSVQNNLTAFAGSNEVQPIQNLTKSTAPITHKKGLTTAGVIVLGVGVLILGGGLGLMNAGKKARTEEDPTFTSTPESFYLTTYGFIFSVVGSLATIAGSTLTIIGVSKKK